MYVYLWYNIFHYSSYETKAGTGKKESREWWLLKHIYSIFLFFFLLNLTLYDLSNNILTYYRIESSQYEIRLTLRVRKSKQNVGLDFSFYSSLSKLIGSFMCRKKASWFLVHITDAETGIWLSLSISALFHQVEDSVLQMVISKEGVICFRICFEAWCDYFSHYYVLS